MVGWRPGGGRPAAGRGRAGAGTGPARPAGRFPGCEQAGGRRGPRPGSGRRWGRFLALAAVTAFLGTAGLLTGPVLAPGRDLSVAASAGEAGRPAAAGEVAPGGAGAGDPGRRSAAGRPARVLVVPVRGNIELGLARFVERGLARAEGEGAAVLLEISSFGGRVDAATEIRGAIDRALDAGVRVLAWVPDRALSAGAMIAITAEELYMAPSATLGAAEPRPADEKTISALRAEFEAIARSRGRDPRVAAAMVDKDVEIPGLVERGRILTLTADRAREIGFIEGIAPDRAAVLSAAGLQGARVEELAPTAAERVARFVTDPVVAPILLSLGLAGVVAEFYVPGFGFPGLVGLLSLALFFGGHLLAGMTGWWVVLLFIAGVLLLAVEMVIPGFGVFGLAGLVAIGAAIVLVTGDPMRGLQSLLIGLVVTGALVAVLARFAGRRGLWRRLALPARLGGEEGFRATASRADWTGQRGRALTPLRPAGSADIGGQRLDVVTEGEFLPAGTPVEVVKVEGPRVVVRALPPDEPAPPPAAAAPPPSPAPPASTAGPAPAAPPPGAPPEEPRP